ncbi:MAG: hypothetical protein VW499_08185 [Candidatus Puniceispirillum sp.]
MKKFLPVLHIGLLAVTLSGCESINQFVYYFQGLFDQETGEFVEQSGPAKPVTKDTIDAEPVVTWDTNYSIFISPPPAVKQEIARRCKDANHDIGMVTVIDLNGKEVTARYRCRGAL